MIDLTVAGVVDPCGRWLASDGGLSADVIFAGVRGLLWELACWRLLCFGRRGFLIEYISVAAVMAI
ncbi:hypothetical protein [Pseudomonas sp. Root562]|uniref:hypothetical protein n=1 Tax=Pseudomonas sp. Root562 TaxID=1736561 RepID=UPI0012E35E91|nr:hypothetical protein [Pseudomonas sp. Root562]